MSNKVLILLSSARKESDTKKFVEVIFQNTEHLVIDFLDQKIFPYNYSHTYPADDSFLKIIDQLLLYKVIVFATPVYWYAMSGLMKIFFDRFTDLITIKKPLGRQLYGKHTFLFAVGAEKELPDGFEVPFKSTSDYLDMWYGGCLYCSTKYSKNEKLLQEEIKLFTSKIESKMKVPK